jgi:6-phosphogluconolactonase (cycloisomerase 2 family)
MFFAVGSYTHPDSPAPEPRGRGISIFDWDESTGRGRLISEYTDIRNPSCLSSDRDSKMLYAVSEEENSSGSVTAFVYSRGGVLKPVGRQEGPGRAGCHLSPVCSPPGIAVVSYGDGRLRIYPLEEGVPGFPVFTYSYQGSGPDSHRQESPHAHQVLPGPDGRFLYVTDLGSDVVWKHSTADAGKDISPALKLPPGYGPRHLAFDPGGQYAYLLCELVPVLLVCGIDTVSGEMRILQELKTSSPGNIHPGAPAAVKIHPSGKTLAVSSRFDNIISVFTISRGGEISGDKRVLIPAGGFSSRGKTPRDICFTESGSRLFIANQDSHNISCRNFNPLTGLPADGWEEDISSGSPVCIVML